MIEVVSDDVVDEQVQGNQLPEYFSGRTAEAHVLGQLLANQHEGMLKLSLRENLIRSWPKRNPQVLFDELDRVLGFLANDGLIQVVYGNNNNTKVKRLIPR